MKKLVLISAFALSCVFPAAGANIFAQQTSAEELTKKVADLEKSLNDADKAMLDMIEKNMGVVNKLRTENRQLRARVKELEESLAQTTKVATMRSVYDSTKDGMAASRQENTELSIDANEPFDRLKSDKDKMYPKGKKAQIQGTGETDKAKERNTRENPEEKSGDSIWDSIFPF